MLNGGDDGVHTGTPHPSGISTTNMFSLHYACDNMGLCVRSRHDADEVLATDCNRNEGRKPITTRKLIRLHAEHIRQQLGRNNFFRLTADY